MPLSVGSEVASVRRQADRGRAGQDGRGYFRQDPPSPRSAFAKTIFAKTIFARSAFASLALGLKHGRAERMFRPLGLTIFNLRHSWRVIFNPELAISADHVFCLLEASGQWVV
jgi:hypothetical protein